MSSPLFTPSATRDFNPDVLALHKHTLNFVHKMVEQELVDVNHPALARWADMRYQTFMMYLNVKQAAEDERAARFLKEQGITPILDMPSEVLALIASKLPPSDANSCVLACKRFYMTMRHARHRPTLSLLTCDDIHESAKYFAVPPAPVDAPLSFQHRARTLFSPDLLVIRNLSMTMTSFKGPLLDLFNRYPHVLIDNIIVRGFTLDRFRENIAHILASVSSPTVFYAHPGVALDVVRGAAQSNPNVVPRDVLLCGSALTDTWITVGRLPNGDVVSPLVFKPLTSCFVAPTVSIVLRATERGQLDGACIRETLRALSNPAVRIHEMYVFLVSPVFTTRISPYPGCFDDFRDTAAKLYDLLAETGCLQRGSDAERATQQLKQRKYDCRVYGIDEQRELEMRNRPVTFAETSHRMMPLHCVK